MRQSHRTAGQGSIQCGRDGRTKFHVYEPQKKGTPKVLIAKCETRWAAERTLAAWHESKKTA